ncbi:TlpA disulfide reductase family protein [Clostridium brassicae]|uniref:TlpA disulfide reductase family protein n=1 Tax=Clostridium brassicae TaxID=2999072 RepID=A0ABT4DCB8_9CLOT|nr:TlpA disulfide reductase family protein [Clostridium brassicae]MCY6958669.1 TlpA disulfide reductase family protein [Clostridium brassicae]
MKRKFLSGIIVLALCFSVVGCGKTSKDKAVENKTNTEQTQKKNIDSEKIVKFESFGIEYILPDSWLKASKSNTLGPEPCGAGEEDKKREVFGEVGFAFISKEDVNELQDKMKKVKTEEEQMKVVMDLQKKSKKLLNIVIFNKDKATKAAKDKMFADFKNHDKLGEKGNYEFYFLYNDQYDDKGLSDSSKKEFKEICDSIKEFKNSIKISIAVTEEEKIKNSGVKNIGDIKTKDIHGKTVDKSIFKENKLTIVDIWATTCGPCVQAMPELQKLQEELKKDKINVMGIVIDALDEETTEVAKNIVEKKGVKYIDIVPDEILKNGILKTITGTPTFIFVDSNGNIVGKPIIGANIEAIKKEALDLVKNIK